MTSHELARLLLETDDLPVGVSTYKHCTLPDTKLALSTVRAHYAYGNSGRFVLVYDDGSFPSHSGYNFTEEKRHG